MKNSNDFWPLVYFYKNYAGGLHVFRELANYVLSVLIFLSSNAVVEQIFSIMNAIKSKLRNKLRLLMLDATLRIRMHFYVKKICCVNFVLTAKMISDFNSKILYNQNETFENMSGEAQSELEVIDMLENIDLPCINLEEIYL